MVFQNPDNQIVSNVVEEDVAFAPENLGVPSDEIRRRVDEALRLVGMGQSGGIFQSSIDVFKTDSGDIYKTIPLGNDLVYDLEFVDSSTLLAVGENSASWYSAAGAELGSYSYGGAYLKDFDLGGDGFLTLSLNMYKAGNRYSVYTVGPDGKALGSVYVGEEILDLSAAGHYVAVLTASKLTIYDDTMQSSVTENDLTAFKKYLDDPDSEIHDYLGENGVVYTYDVRFGVWSYDENGTLVSSDADPDEAGEKTSDTGFGAMKVQLTQGSEENIKITTPLDLHLADLILKGRRKL